MPCHPCWQRAPPPALVVDLCVSPMSRRPVGPRSACSFPAFSHWSNASNCLAQPFTHQRKESNNQGFVCNERVNAKWLRPFCDGQLLPWTCGQAGTVQRSHFQWPHVLGGWATRVSPCNLVVAYVYDPSQSTSCVRERKSHRRGSALNTYALSQWLLGLYLTGRPQK